VKWKMEDREQKREYREEKKWRKTDYGCVGQQREEKK